MNNTDQIPESKNSVQSEYSTYDLFILVISILSLFVMLLFILPGVGETTTEIAFVLDIVFSLIFLYDFFRSLIRAADRREYFLAGGWLDLLGSVPAIPILRLFRLARLLRILRTIRRMSAEEIWRVYKENRADSAFWTTLLLTMFLLTFTSIVIIPIEADSPNAQIIDSSDALWWSIVTVTTVGYGDEVPATDGGRILASSLMTLGVALVSVLTSYVTSSLILRGDKEENERRERLENGIKQLNARFDRLEKMLEEVTNGQQ
jgi:voltage-gated potassium channel